MYRVKDQPEVIEKALNIGETIGARLKADGKL